MNVDINLDSIQADIQAIEAMFEKYQIDPSTAYDHESSNVHFPDDVQLENLLQNIEDLGFTADVFNNGFHKILFAAREECERRKIV